MTDRIEIRKEAYRFILQRLNTLHAEVTGTGWMQIVSLEELRLLKEGIADPSASLVAVLKDQLKGTVNDQEIDSYLVEPFNSPL
jgi:hypothetical protein